MDVYQSRAAIIPQTGVSPMTIAFPTLDPAAAAADTLAQYPRARGRRRRAGERGLSSLAAPVPTNVRFATFVRQWKILPNRLNPTVGFDGLLYDTTISELETVSRFPVTQVWTLVVADGLQSIQPGFVQAGRIGHFLAAEAFDVSRPPEPIQLF